jgi:glycosyltransferase involved in cell wall biosynthesis
MQPFLSIVTINYNNCIGLEKTIASVISQNYRNFEFLVIDGDSTDGSKAILAKNKDRINYSISEPDTGIYNAMNKGIKVASGEYLLFLNSGDVLNGVIALESFILHPDFVGDIIYGDYKFEKGEKVYPEYLTPLFFVRSSLPHQSTFFKKEVFDTMGFYDEKYKIVSDRAFYIKCFLSNQFIFKHINFPLTVYDLSGISNDFLRQEEQIVENESMFKEYYGVFYDDYKKMNQMISQLNQARRETLSGILKRVMNKIKKTCYIR